MKKYILKDKKPVLCEDLIKWSKWFHDAERHVAGNTINGIRVSTVFLGLDHSYFEDEPILFETMIFGGEHDQSHRMDCIEWCAET